MKQKARDKASHNTDGREARPVEFDLTPFMGDKRSLAQIIKDGDLSELQELAAAVNPFGESTGWLDHLRDSLKGLGTAGLGLEGLGKGAPHFAATSLAIGSLESAEAHQLRLLLRRVDTLGTVSEAQNELLRDQTGLLVKTIQLLGSIREEQRSTTAWTVRFGATTTLLILVTIALALWAQL